MIVPVVLLLVSQLLLPAYLIVSVMRGRDASRQAWIARTACAAAYILYVFLAGRWDWVSYYARYVMVVLFAAAAVAGAVRVWRRPAFIAPAREARAEIAISLAVLALFVSLLALAIAGRRYTGEPVRLALPLEDGTYYVGQGGSSSLLNYHHGNRAQRFAIDVVALNRLGSRARAMYPTSLEQYEIFGAIVYSPCDGTVREAVDGFPDHVPPMTDRERPAGNHVVIACQGVQVELAHLQNGSVRDQRGTAVVAGQSIGRVGNSGNTTEPHLHVHAMRDDANAEAAAGVPILFDGTFAVRNHVFIESRRPHETDAANNR